MQKIFFLMLVLTAASCNDHQLIVNGAEREYLVYEPKKGTNFPVLLVLHGNPSTGWQMKTWTGMNEVASKEEFIVVYPYALDKRWPINPDENADEVEYIRELLIDLDRNYSIDKSRIYLSGMSGGGIFSFQLLRELKNSFAAFAVVSGNMPLSYDTLGFEATPFMYVHGTKDFLYPGREDLASAESTLSTWQIINRAEEMNVDSLSNLNDKDESEVLRIQFGGTAPILFYQVIDGGHHWPQAKFDANLFYSDPLGNFNKDLNTNQAIWDFVSQFSIQE